MPQAMMQYRKWEKGTLREDGRPGFDTPSGKFEIASSILEEYGYDPLPRYAEPKESPLSTPDDAEKFPLIFNSGARHNLDLHALHQSVPALAKEYPAPTVLINKMDAERRGIANGDKVRIKTRREEDRDVRLRYRGTLSQELWRQAGWAVASRVPGTGGRRA